MAGLREQGVGGADTGNPVVLEPERFAADRARGLPLRWTRAMRPASLSNSCFVSPFA